MQAALAEMAAENLTQDVEDDNDFTVVNGMSPSLSPKGQY
jgi:hypothetical protein